MLMIEPPPRACICGTTACAAKKTCRRLTPIIQSNSAGVTSASTWRWSLAALLISTAASPSAARTSAIAARKAAMSSKSQATNSGAEPHIGRGARQHRLTTEPQQYDGLRAGGLDHLNRRIDDDGRARCARKPAAPLGNAFRPDPKHHLAAAKSRGCLVSLEAKADLV